MRRNCGYRADSSCDGSGSALAHSGRFPCGWVVCSINGKLTVNNPFTVAIQLTESNIGFVPTALLFTIHWTRKAEMSGSVRKIFWKAFHFTTDISSLKRRYRNERFSKKYAPMLLRKRECVISADMRFERIASTSGVRSHRKNGQFSLAPDLLILLLGKPHTPFMSKLKMLPELFEKVLAFIRFDDYNYTAIL